MKTKKQSMSTTFFLIFVQYLYCDVAENILLDWLQFYSLVWLFKKQQEIVLIQYSYDRISHYRKAQ